MGTCWSSHHNLVIVDPIASSTEQTAVTTAEVPTSRRSNSATVEPRLGATTSRSTNLLTRVCRGRSTTNSGTETRADPSLHSLHRPRDRDPNNIHHTSSSSSSNRNSGIVRFALREGHLRPTFAFDDSESHRDNNIVAIETYSAEDIDTLVQELRIMETLFQSIFGAPGPGNTNTDFFPQMWMQQDTNPQSGGPPPISDRAMRQLPDVVVTQNDLLDQANRECCICFCDINLGDKLTRLPCGHLYHRPCVSEWLLKHCTCPVCRYELETNDPVYERGRIERMASRKPRYHKYELDRMAIRELHDLMRRVNLIMDHRHMATEKSELIEFILNSGKIDIISVAAPVPSAMPQFKISEIKSLSIGKLRKAMADSGVFYDPGDVVEKNDMIQIFVNSGRVVILPEDNVEDVGGASPEQHNSDLQHMESQLTRSSEEAVQEEEWELVDATDASAETAPTVFQSALTAESLDMDDQDAEEFSNDVALEEESESSNAERSLHTEVESNMLETNYLTEVQTEPQQLPESPVATEGIATQDRSSSYSSTSRSSLSSYTISQLRQLAYQLNVSLSGCLEKNEMIDRIAMAAVTRRNDSR